MPIHERRDGDEDEEGEGCHGVFEGTELLKFVIVTRWCPRFKFVNILYISDIVYTHCRDFIHCKIRVRTSNFRICTLVPVMTTMLLFTVLVLLELAWERRIVIFKSRDNSTTFVQP